MKHVFLMLFFLMYLQNVYAQKDDYYNRINLSSSAEQQSQNDVVSITLVASFNHAQSSVVASKINKNMEWALHQLAPFKNIVVKTENYRINAIYKKERFIEWRGKQNIVLKSADVSSMSQITSVLLNKLQIQSQSYSLSFKKKEQIENKLIKQALDSLKKRAAIVVGSFNAKQYRIVNLNISTQSSRPVYRSMRKSNYMAESLMSSDGPNVASQSGQSTVKVSVNGQIELVL